MITVHQESLRFHTNGRGTSDITGSVAKVVTESSVQVGTVHLFLRHTSASLILCENADPRVRSDLERWLATAIQDGDPLFQHRDEGADDMPAHVRSVLTASELTLPITDGALNLGTWQGVYLYEHRLAPHRRSLWLTVIGTGSG